MKIQEFGEQYCDMLSRISISVPSGCYLYQPGVEIMEMVNAYCNDGWNFFQKGDYVNAHASFTYGTGWLNAGIALGILGNSESFLEIPDFENDMPDRLAEHLIEKTNRYYSMLSGACEALDIAPDSGSPMYKAARDILLQGEKGLNCGYNCLKEKSYVQALASFSYGYGWLDAGIRAGLFRIKGDRHLFTI